MKFQKKYSRYSEYIHFRNLAEGYAIEMNVHTTHLKL